MKIRKISQRVLLSFLIIMLVATTGCGKKNASSVISGTVSGDLAANITINLTGEATASTTTDANGNFSFSSVNNGYYTVTPSRDGYTFSPSSNAANVDGASVTGVNFTSAFSGYSISGTVTGAVVANVTITGSGCGLSGSVATNADGYYSQSGITVACDYTLTPSYDGYTFSPSSNVVAINGASVSEVDFTSTFTGYSISGTVTGAVVANVVMTLSYAGANTILLTASNGSYAFTAITAAGNYTVTPSYTGYTFSPSSNVVAINGASVTGVNFAGSASP